MMNTMLYSVLANFSERMWSSAIVDSTRSATRYAPMMPVNMAARALTAMTARPKLPMYARAALKVGTEATPLSLSRSAT